MLFVRPYQVDDASLVYSSLTEDAPGAWSAVTNYGIGDRVGVASGSAVQVYKSSQAANTNHDPTTSPSWWLPDGTTHLPWSAATTYASGDRVLDATTHRIFESLVNANLNHPTTDPAFWIDVAPSNKWAMFDSYNATQSVHPYQIVQEMTLQGRADSLALLNMTNAGSVRVQVTTPADGLVYDRTFNLISSAGVSSWFAFFFEPLEYATDLFVSDLPAYLDPTIDLTIEANGNGDIGVGVLSVGLAKDLGLTLHDSAQIGITDYSRKAVDDFGNYTIIKRAFSRRGSFRSRIQKSAVDGVFNALSDYRSTPTVYLASEDYGATLIFGFFKDFTIEIDYPTESLVSIEIEGLT
jgi:hypothetical protein